MKLLICLILALLLFAWGLILGYSYHSRDDEPWLSDPIDCIQYEDCKGWSDETLPADAKRIRT